MSKQQFDIVTCGWLFEEYITFPNHTIGPVIGGSVAYSSAVLAKLGAKVGVITNVGEQFDKQMLEPLYSSGADLTGVHKKPGTHLTVNHLIYDSSGKKTMNYISQSAHFTSQDIPRNYFNTQMMFFCTEDFEVKPDLLELVRKKGIRVAADMGGLGGAHNSTEGRQKYYQDRERILRDYMRQIEIAKISEEDAYYIFGECALPRQEITNQLLRLGASVVILTLGQNGALVATEHGSEIVPPLPTAPGAILDTTGAGDTHTAAFLMHYLQNGNLSQACLFANAASSLLIEKTGGVSSQRIPDRIAVERRMKGI